MSSKHPNSSLNVMAGPEQDYVERVLLLKESDAVRPGSTRIHQISIKPVTVKAIIKIYIIFHCRFKVMVFVLI